MTVTSATGASAPAAPGTVTATIDGVTVTVPQGTLIIRAAELLGVEVPRFCDHPLLEPVAACRACLVEIEGQPKPQPSCAIPVGDGMVVRTQVTSEVAAKAQQGVMEFLLINHPLDCPICDKGGECPLQNQAMSAGRPASRFDGTKRTFPKPINISAQILLDRERCVSCARCTRFADQIAGDPLISLQERGGQQQIGISEESPFDSYFSGNTVQICPVGALTSARYRFRSRPFDLVSVPTACEHCASGCELRTDVRRSTVMRRQAADDPQVNEEWNCDKGRFAFTYLTEGRLEQPLVRAADGTLVTASWPEAIAAAARGLAPARGRAAVLAGGRLTLEDSYAYAKFARVALGTDDLDFRARPHSAEETAFLAALVAGRGVGPTYAELEQAPVVVLAGLDPEDESPIIFLRLRKAARKGRLPVLALAPWTSPGLAKLHGSLLPTAPGDEARALDALADDSAALDADGHRAAALLREPGAVLLVGERLATSPGALSAAARLAAATGARLGWVPRRAGERGALDAGLLPGLLPGGRPLADAAARAEVAAAWGVDADALPAEAGRDGEAIVAAAIEGGYDALVVAGIDPDDTVDPAATRAALAAAPFVVALETRATSVLEHADVVLPVGVVTEKSGTFVDWEGRRRPFDAVLRASFALTDARALAMIADELDLAFGRQETAALRRELDGLGAWGGERPGAPSVAPGAAASAGAGEAVLSTWHHLLDLGTLQEGEPYLAATSRRATARLSAGTATEVGVADGDLLVVATDAGALELPVTITDMPDRTVWLPTNSSWSQVRRTLGVDNGAVVRLSRGGAQ